MRLKIVVPILIATALVAAGCGGRDGATESPAPAASAGPGDFGDLKNVCQGGTSTSSPAQGVTASQIKVGTFSDIGYTKNSEFVDTAKVFTSWCNEAGGINGRKLVSTTRDSALQQVTPRMIEACAEDFALVGGGSALDALGVKDRLTCLLPDFPAQVSQSVNVSSDLQLNQTSGSQYFRYQGFYKWLTKEAYPGSASGVGIITGDSPVTKVIIEQTKEALGGLGVTPSYTEFYPLTGVADWTPYAQAIKTKGVKGLIFLGDFASLAKLEQVLTSIQYKLDWIDANNNAYNPAFLQLAGPSLAYQNNLADLGGIHPIEKASANPATAQVQALFKKYAPDAQLTLPALRAFSAWLLFAKAAASCGDALTRTCVYTAARKESAWTGGGLQAAVDLSGADAPLKCFNVEKAGANGWEPADFKPDKGSYRCDAPAYKYTGQYGKPLSLADVGKSMSDLK